MLKNEQKITADTLILLDEVKAHFLGENSIKLACIVIDVVYGFCLGPLLRQGKLELVKIFLISG